MSNESKPYGVGNLRIRMKGKSSLLGEVGFYLVERVQGSRLPDQEPG